MKLGLSNLYCFLKLTNDLCGLPIFPILNPRQYVLAVLSSDLSPIFTTTLKVTTFFIVILSKVYYLHCFINSIGVKFFKLECGLSSL
jgi:hypothetical protein